MEKKLHCGDLFKRVLSLAMALVMLLSFAPVPHAHAADGMTVYFSADHWAIDGARFAAYYFGGNMSPDNGWVNLTATEDAGVYTGVIPSGYTSVIFCRMNGSSTANSWDNKWNKTADLTLPTDGKNYFIVSEGAWEGANGTWTTYTPAQPDEPVTEATYVVTGDASLCGSNWDPTDVTNNKMELKDGLYTKTYSDVPAGTYRIKVTDGKGWEEGEDWGDNGQNYVFEVSAACDVTVTFNEETKAVNVTGDSVAKVTTLDITAMYAVGNGSGNWLNGVNWNEKADANDMTETSKGVYEITYKSVPEGDAYEVKFAANGSWDDNWGGTFVESGVATDAVYNSSANIKFAVSYDAADVTLKLDLTNFNYSTKNGAKFTVTITEVEAEPVKPTVDYYLFGSINGADYGCEKDSANMGEYKFVNGKLTATFTADSYVAVKTTDNAKWYMTDGWLGTEVTSATLYDTTTLGTGANKLFVPANTEVVFTLVENEDGTLTLSYAPAVEGTKVTIHFLKPETWGSSINAYLWTDSGAVAGYSDYNAWPGKAVSDADGDGWYDLVVETESKFKFIFNDGGKQTADLTTPDFTDSIELWVVDNTVYTEQPDYTAVIHFQKPSDWNKVYAYVWNPFAAQGESNAIPGYESYNGWPGAVIEENAANAGWYDLTVTKETNVGFNFIFNNYNGTQTGNLWSGELSFNTELWFYADETQAQGTPTGWIDPNRTAHVPGTFPGPSWDAASNQMTYDPELGLYVYTFKNVPPANYEFKIAINGSWTENYGVGGVRDGGNIAVAVPKTMDVTVYYNDKTHNAVTSVTYKFLDIDLSGTGIPEGTKMTDEGLTGIYKATVTLPAGEYSDIKMSIKDGAENTFNAFELEKEKDVTFFYDPASGLYYCDAIPSEIDETKVYFDSQDVDYKAPFGSPATGEEVTFSIDTGAEVKQVSLVITGKEQKTVELTTDAVALAEADGTSIITWTGKVALNTMGEYDYYFVLSDGSAPVVYCDDDGYYGEGQVTDLSSVKPYDLVVHKAGFETPDWMKDAVIYQIFPDRFFDGDESNNQAQTWARGTVDYEYITDWYTLPENPEQMAKLDKATYESTGAWYGDGEWSNEIYGGDLEGITERIDYLKALGVNVIYLNPVFWSISSHRYDAVDYTEIDPILGTLGDFEELVSVAEANGMHIILDGVFNHVSDDSVYFDRYYKFLPDAAEKFDGKIGAYPYWAYVYDYMEEKGADQGEAETAAKAYFTAEYGITDYSYTEWFEVSSTKNENGVYSYQGWWGYDSMPIIKSTNGSEYQTGNWAEEIIYNEEGTSVTQYWITKGNNGWRLDVANEVSDETWQNFRASVKALNSDVVIIGEIWDDATKYLMGDMYDSVMNYQFRSAVTNFAMGTNAETTTKTMEKIRERYPEEAFYAMMNLVGSHDTTRILSYLDGIGDDRADKSMAAAFPTYEGTSAVAKQRQYLVSFLQFTYAGAPTIYYGDEIGMVGADDPDDRRAFEWGKGNRELVEWYAKLAAIRDAYPALRTGSVQPIDTRSDNLMGFSRTLNDQTLIVVTNNSANEQMFVPENAYLESYVDLISGKTYVATDSSYTVPAYSGIILVAADEVENLDLNLAGLAPAYDESYIVAIRQTPAAGEETHSHNYGEDGTVVEPTCTEQGYTSYTCECGDVYMTDFVKPTGHDYTETVTEPTCTEKGYTTYTCSVCEDTYTDDEVDALGHNFVESVTNPTCTETGKTLLTCEGCGECVISKEVDALGHNYEGGACTRCGEDDPNSVPSTPITPAKPNWKNWLDKIFGNWWGNKDEKPQEPTEPEKPSEPETEPSEPEKPTVPEETVPSKPITPIKPNWSGIIKKIFGWWKK